MTTTQKVLSLYAKLLTALPSEVFAQYSTEQLHRLAARCEVLARGARSTGLYDALRSIKHDIREVIELREEDEVVDFAVEYDAL